MKDTETASIEVENCLTDQCQSCTGYYNNEILSSKIICRCKCHNANSNDIDHFDIKLPLVSNGINRMNALEGDLNDY